MIAFLDTLKLTAEAKEEITKLIFGDLTPDEGIKLNDNLSKLQEEELMLFILKCIRLSR